MDTFLPSPCRPPPSLRGWHLVLTALLTLASGLAATTGLFPWGDALLSGLWSQSLVMPWGRPAGWLSRLLFEVRVLDAPAFLGATLCLSSVSLVATWRSTRDEPSLLPSEALRSE
ncbi:hypothetical protein ACLESD_15945 [Pyxidicoccus sp. 3LFB2]